MSCINVTENMNACIFLEVSKGGSLIADRQIAVIKKEDHSMIVKPLRQMSNLCQGVYHLDESDIV